MAFCFKRKESVAKGVRRLGRHRIENALECLKDCRHAEAIHCARKDIKKARAVLRMVRSNIVRKEFRRFTKLLREAASHLAAPRDAYVKAKALTNLARHFKGQLAPGALRHIRSQLRRASDDETKRFVKEKRAKAVERLLRSVAKEFECLEISGKGWKAIGPGVKSAYSEGRRAYQTVLKDPAPENFHEWRKRAKDLSYQVSLLRPVWPEQMDAIARELETLGEYLGDDHDLFILQQSVQEQCAGDGDQRELEILHGLIDERQRELRSAAVALGTRFYAEKSSTFCERLGGYWNTWRREKTRCVQSAEAMP
jgi:CHAD domain-containing protein